MAPRSQIRLALGGARQVRQISAPSNSRLKEHRPSRSYFAHAEKKSVGQDCMDLPENQVLNCREVLNAHGDAGCSIISNPVIPASTVAIRQKMITFSAPASALRCLRKSIPYHRRFRVVSFVTPTRESANKVAPTSYIRMSLHNGVSDLRRAAESEARVVCNSRHVQRPELGQLHQTPAHRLHAARVADAVAAARAPKYQ